MPVYLTRQSIERLETTLGLRVLEDGRVTTAAGKEVTLTNEIALTGNIDFVQVRNGQIHLLAFKSHAAAEKPIEQMTWKALALSCLTGLSLYAFKCAWFDDQDYFEFYPLHVIYAMRKLTAHRN